LTGGGGRVKRGRNFPAVEGNEEFLHALIKGGGISRAITTFLTDSQGARKKYKVLLDQKESSFM